MSKEFTQRDWSDAIERDLDRLLRLAVPEDAGEAGDLTTLALVPEGALGRATAAVRSDGVIAGLPAARLASAAIDRRLEWSEEVEDGQFVEAGRRVATMEGPARGLLQAERLVLNLLGRLSGIATLTGEYVKAVSGTSARIYDTRKTTPGWRLLEKYAVRCGGGCNHRTGLYDAVLIKDNHLALGAGSGGTAGTRFSPAEAVRRARRFLEEESPGGERPIVEVEVDTLDQLREVLAAGPDIVLLDNMPPDRLREAVAIRDEADPTVELEASGGVNLETVSGIAASGVDRISVGALTHSAVSLDLGLDWIG